MRITPFFFLCACLRLGLSQRVDLTRVNESKGADVVEAVVNLLRRSCIFADDLLYLRRVAYADTHDGEDPFTYVLQFNGGIWHITETDFNDTKIDPSLEHYRQDISKELFLDWTTVTYSDLRKPLYSAIATQLSTILKIGNGSYPLTTNRQAELWSRNGAKDPGSFLNAVKQLEKGLPVNHNLDIVFLLDSSASMSGADFNKSKQFVISVVSELDVDNGLTRVAVVEYSWVVYSTVALDNHLSGSHLLETISNITYKPGGTNTNAALQYVQDHVFTVNNGSRSNAAKVVVLVIADGRSGDNVTTIKTAQSLKATGVTIFAVGVGNLIDKRELSLIVSEPSCAHLKTVNNYTDLLADSHSSLQLAVQAPMMLKPGIYEFSCSSDVTAVIMATKRATTIEIITSDGALDVFGSGSTAFVPNSAIFSFNETVTTEVPVDIYVRDGSQIIVNFRRLSVGGCLSSYKVKVLAGDHLQTGNHKICIEAGLVGRCSQKDIIDSPFIITGTADPTIPSVCGVTDTFTAPYPGKSDRYLLCSSGRLIAVYCLQNQMYDPVLSLCVHTATQSTKTTTTTTTTKTTTTTTPKIIVPTKGVTHTGVDVTPSKAHTTETMTSTTASPTTTNKPLVNPCTAEHIASGLFIWPHPFDERLYIKCGLFALSANVLECGEHMHYSKTAQTCTYKDVIADKNGSNGVTFDGTSNPCKTDYVGDVQYYPYPGDHHKFIQCDAYGDAYVKECRLNEVWEPKINNCIPTGDTSGLFG